MSATETNRKATQPAAERAASPPGDVPEIDISSAEARKTSFADYAAQRARCPVTQAMLFSNNSPDMEAGAFVRPAWLFYDYEDSNRALLNPAVSVDITSAMTPEELEQIPEAPPEFKPLQRNLLSVEPPEHTRLRKLVQPSFTASAIEKLRPGIQALTDRLLDRIEADAAARGEVAPNRTMELIADFSYELPVTVICDMLGIPENDREQTRVWSENLLKPINEEERDAIGQGIGEFITYLRELFVSKRAAPTDDLISQLLVAEVEGDKLTEDEVVAMVFILFVAGHVTTVNLIANGVFALLTNPEQARALWDDPSLTVNAVEEVLRYYGPAETTTPRFAAADVEFNGQQIRKGDPMLIVLASANHDPARFADPETFDISRSDANRHIAFGKGIHACLGAPLARLEAQIAIATIFQRYPDLRLGAPVEEIAWQSSFLRSLDGLPLKF